jgi:hypothetical protein
VSDRSLNSLLRDLIQYESLSVAMEDYPLSVKEIVTSIEWLKDHVSSDKDKIYKRWAIDLTDAEEESQSPIIGRVCLFVLPERGDSSDAFVDRLYTARATKSSALSIFFHAGKPHPPSDAQHIIN